MINYQLFRPLAFLNVFHKDILPIRWTIPLIIALLVTSCLSTFHIAYGFDLFSEKGFFERIFGMLSILPGFYIAALAAVATFGHKDMDNILPSPAPTLTYYERGKPVPRKLTKRQFVSLLFSFLTLESLFLFLFLSITLPAAHLPILLNSNLKEILAVIYTFCVLLVLSQLFVITMYGLYFLGDRIHRTTDTEVPRD